MPKKEKTYRGLPTYISPFDLTIRPELTGCFTIAYMSLRGEGMTYDSDYVVRGSTLAIAIRKMKKLLIKHECLTK